MSNATGIIAALTADMNRVDAILFRHDIAVYLEKRETMDPGMAITSMMVGRDHFSQTRRVWKVAEWIDGVTPPASA